MNITPLIKINSLDLYFSGHKLAKHTGYRNFDNAVFDGTDKSAIFTVLCRAEVEFRIF